MGKEKSENLNMVKERKIVILGRPNVGKSTLFNRLLKTRKAIIDPTPGVTRDVIQGRLELCGQKIKLFDTGGLTDEGDQLNTAVQQKSWESMKSADLIIFMVEAGTLLPIEEEYIHLIRKNKKKFIFVMNKSDSPEKDIFIHDFHQYGIGEPIAVSAAHNRNIDLLMEQVELLLKKDDSQFNSNRLSSQAAAPDVDLETEEELEISAQTIRMAVVGKPNVGKSSLLNRIIGQPRSIVSHIAGTTRDIVDEEFCYRERDFVILDTAGIRKKTKVNEDIEYYSVNRAIKTISEANVVILVLDSLQDLSEQDKKITDQIVKHGKGLIIALNKWDLQDNGQAAKSQKKETIRFKFPVVDYAPVIPVSALTGYGIKKLLNMTITVFEQLHIKISTPELNDFIQQIIRQYSPSSKKGILKIFYGVQSSLNPVEFIFFLNNKKLLTKSYQQYIVNKLRSYFGFTGIPLKIIFKNK